jgi:hypothetical protein
VQVTMVAPLSVKMVSIVPHDVATTNHIPCDIPGPSASCRDFRPRPCAEQASLL